MKCRQLIVALAVLVAFVPFASASPFGYSVSTTTGVNGGSLYRIDLANGSTTLVGALGLPVGADVEAIDFDPTTGILYGYDDTGLGLYTIDTTTGAATSVGGTQILTNAGLSFDAAGQGYIVEGPRLRSLNKSTGAVTTIGTGADGLASCAFIGNTLYAMPDISNPSVLLTVNLATGAQSVVGSMGFQAGAQSGMDYDPATNRLYVLNESNDGIYIINPANGMGTLVGFTPSQHIFESLAIVPEPAGLGLLCVSFAATALCRRSRALL